MVRRQAVLYSALVVAIVTLVSCSSATPRLVLAKSGADASFAEVAYEGLFNLDESNCIRLGDRVVVAASGSSASRELIRIRGFGTFKMGDRARALPVDLAPGAEKPGWLPDGFSDWDVSKLAVFFPREGF